MFPFRNAWISRCHPDHPFHTVFHRPDHRNPHRRHHHRHKNHHKDRHHLFSFDDQNHYDNQKNQYNHNERTENQPHLAFRTLEQAVSPSWVEASADVVSSMVCLYWL